MEKIGANSMLPDQIAPEYFFTDYLFFEFIGLCFWLSNHFIIDFVMRDSNHRYQKKTS
jgi:hypothetical protein